ncbi:methyltransferase domain-containing protein [Candidatus Woesearchaeota archaeon]|jgi:tRNA (adenine57-N1/adenine58-N1)-methyltransferase|nr:methyltransferase domain-containing protein [Candidatus Woesearchaeota archaeon]
MTKKTIYKLPYSFEDDKGRKRNLDSFEKHVVNTDKDFNFGAGILTKEDLTKEGFIKVNKHDVYLIQSDFNDEYSKMTRGAQTITKKDIGPIITKTGINKESIIIDAGAGSGGLCCFLGKIAKEVHTFDVSQKNLDIVNKNIKKLNLNNVEAELKDIYEPEHFSQEKYDVFTLDVPEPWKAWETAIKVLKIGGYLVVYSPNVMQIREVTINKPKNFFLEEINEIIERDWSISEKVSRPVTKDFSHTAFLAFFRKLGN